MVVLVVGVGGRVRCRVAAGAVAARVDHGHPVADVVVAVGGDRRSQRARPVGVGSRLPQEVVGVVVLVGGRVAVGVGDARFVSGGVVGVGRRVAELVGFGQQAALAVVAVA